MNVAHLAQKGAKLINVSIEGPTHTPQEETLESIPSRDEILWEIGQYFENPIVNREFSDERGPYFIEVVKSRPPSGEETLYIYHRKGIFPDNNASAVTRIEVIYFKDNMPVGGEDLATYNPQTKKWE